MNTFKNLLNNNKKFVYLIISVLVIAVIIIVAVLVNITNKGGRDTSDMAGATIESRTDSQVLTESTIDKSNINKNEDNNETVSADNESTENSAENSGNDIAQEDDTEVTKETSQEQYISSDNGGSDDEEGVAADDNNVNQEASSGHIVYNADGSLNLQESYWESYKGWKEFQNAIGSNSQFQQLISKAQSKGIPVSGRWSLVGASSKGSPKDVQYYIYPDGLDYYYMFGYDGNDFYFIKQYFMNIGYVGDPASQNNFDNNIVYKDDGTLNLQESYWHYEDSESLYKSIISTPEFKQAINGFRSSQIRYPKTSGKITAKTQQWIVVYPDGSEYHFLFDGSKYCRMPKWND